MTIKICHICLDENEYSETDTLKKCCNAFICNICWSKLQNNDSINNCPICKKILSEIINENETEITIDEMFIFSSIYELIIKLIKLINLLIKLTAVIVCIIFIIIIIFLVI